jgi:hypothetical protein
LSANVGQVIPCVSTFIFLMVSGSVRPQISGMTLAAFEANVSFPESEPGRTCFKMSGAIGSMSKTNGSATHAAMRRS